MKNKLLKLLVLVLSLCMLLVTSTACGEKGEDNTEEYIETTCNILNEILETSQKFYNLVNSEYEG